MKVDDPESLPRKDIHLHCAGVKVNRLYFEVLLLVSLLHDGMLIFKLNIVDSGSKHSQLADINHVKQIGDHSLITEVDGLKAHIVSEVP